MRHVHLNTTNTVVAPQLAYDKSESEVKAALSKRWTRPTEYLQRIRGFAMKK